MKEWEGRGERWVKRTENINEHETGYGPVNGKGGKKNFQKKVQYTDIRLKIAP